MQGLLFDEFILRSHVHLGPYSINTHRQRAQAQTHQRALARTRVQFNRLVWSRYSSNVSLFLQSIISPQVNYVGGQMSNISLKACGRCCINWPIFIRLLERLIYFKVGKPQQEMTLNNILRVAHTYCMSTDWERSQKKYQASEFKRLWHTMYIMVREWSVRALWNPAARRTQSNSFLFSPETRTVEGLHEWGEKRGSCQNRAKGIKIVYAPLCARSHF